MPDYFSSTVCGYRLYFTSSCTIEAFHVHASNKRKYDEKTAAKQFVYANGDTRVMRCGDVSTKDMTAIQRFIKANYLSMYALWQQYSAQTYYNKR